MNPQAFWALAPKASVFAISPLPHVAMASLKSMSNPLLWQHWLTQMVFQEYGA